MDEFQGVRSHEIAELAERFDGWLEWDQFELTDAHLTYAYDDHVTISTAADLEEFLETIGEKYAVAGWAHFDDDVTYYGPSEHAKLQAEIAQLGIELNAVQTSLAAARAKLASIS